MKYQRFTTAGCRYIGKKVRVCGEYIFVVCCSKEMSEIYVNKISSFRRIRP